MEKNPSLIQAAPSFRQGNAPLILIHDGGGTPFGYHCLPSLQRTVYAIHNPHFYSGRPWPGGIPAMARIYIELIRSSIPAGDFILGGWSFGGLVSFEIASILSRGQTDLTVLGLVMMDSIYPGSVKKYTSNIAPQKPFLGDRCRPEIRMLCSAMMKQSAKMAEQWEIPTWPRTSDSISLSFKRNNGRTSVTTRNLNLEGLDSNSDRWSSGTATPTEDKSKYLIHDDSKFEFTYDEKVLERHRPPRIVLLRCQEKVPVSPASTWSETISRVDVARDSPHLGWEDYDPQMINAVLDLPGHHYGLFWPENVSLSLFPLLLRELRNPLSYKIRVRVIATAAQLYNACEMLEAPNELDVV